MSRKMRLARKWPQVRRTRALVYRTLTHGSAPDVCVYGLRLDTLPVWFIRSFGPLPSATLKRPDR
jgi:hypothetical protein